METTVTRTTTRTVTLTVTRTVTLSVTLTVARGYTRSDVGRSDDACCSSSRTKAFLSHPALLSAQIWQVLSAFCSDFQALQPARLPAFAFGWTELISHRMFMPKLLLAKGQKGWP